MKKIVSVIIQRFPCWYAYTMWIQLSKFLLREQMFTTTPIFYMVNHILTLLIAAFLSKKWKDNRHFYCNSKPNYLQSADLIPYRLSALYN